MYLTRYTHFQPTMFCVVDGGTKTHVLLRSRALNLSCMACRHRGSLDACEKHVGSEDECSSVEE